MYLKTFKLFILSYSMTSDTDTNYTDSDIDIIIINDLTFLNLKFNENIINTKVEKIINNIINDHECFSLNYKYIPQNDQNYKSKVSSQQKKHKNLINIDDNSKNVFSLLNKLSESNYKIIEEKIIYKIKKINNKKDFLKKLIKYGETSNVYTNLLSNIIKHLYHKNKNDVEDLYIEYQDEYMNSFNFNDYYKNFDYNNYEDFCIYIKNCNIKFNALCTLIQISLTIPTTKLNIIKLFNYHYNLINSLQQTDCIYKDKYICEVYKHIEHYFKYTNIINILLCEKHYIDKFINQCEYNKISFDKNLKLKFKIDDILTLFIQKINKN